METTIETKRGQVMVLDLVGYEAEIETLGEGQDLADVQAEIGNGEWAGTGLPAQVEALRSSLGRGVKPGRVYTVRRLIQHTVETCASCGKSMTTWVAKGGKQVCCDCA
jgi:hypothetical protein